jgi:hypothetical protein
MLAHVRSLLAPAHASLNEGYRRRRAGERFRRSVDQPADWVSRRHFQVGCRPLDRRLGMRCALSLALALLTLTAGCDFFYNLTHERNPGFCCEDPTWCKQWGAPGPIACENPGEVCDIVNNVCMSTGGSSDRTGGGQSDRTYPQRGRWPQPNSCG